MLLLNYNSDIFVLEQLPFEHLTCCKQHRSRIFTKERTANKRCLRVNFVPYNLNYLQLLSIPQCNLTLD